LKRAPVTSADLGLYVHFPYCEKKCPYCDFNSHVMPHDDDRYADAIVKEIELRAEAYARGRPFSTIYFGGGTPSLWAPSCVGRVISFVNERFGLVSGAEITLEANPGTVHEQLFSSFVEAGVNRFSIGAQSFIDQELVQLGRIHDAGASARAVAAAKRSGARVSLDLIYGQPGQSWAVVERSVDRALALEPDHLSAYTLTIEPGTVLARQRDSGAFTPMADDDQAELIERVTSRFESAGYVRYEISSYAPEGSEARHNTIYWMGGDYLGVGAGAHSYRAFPDLRGAHRSANVKSPIEWESRALSGESTLGFEERLEKKDAIAERLMLGMRVRWGIDLASLAAEGGLDLGALEAAIAPDLGALAVDGLITRDGTLVRPTPRGFLFADAVGRRLLEAADHHTWT
jgi:putative oxygen-independent coproporphyrinogen III oxidase